MRRTTTAIMVCAFVLGGASLAAVLGNPASQVGTIAPASNPGPAHAFTAGDYPRMAQVGDLLLVAYHRGTDIVIGGINLTSGLTIPPVTAIPGAGRPMLLYDVALDRLLCIFNYGGLGDGAAIGIAWASAQDWANASAWTIQDGILGPVAQPFDEIGCWEPYIAAFANETYLLFFSNQTLYDPAHPIDSGGYWFSDEGPKINQEIDVTWLSWNGTGFAERDAGTVSNDVGGSGTNIHDKDGMASAALVGHTASTKSYVITFECFPRGMPASIDAVRITVSLAGGVSSDWRVRVTTEDATAPFIAAWNGALAVSYRNHAGSGSEVLGLAGLPDDGNGITQPLHATACGSVWPSICALANGSLYEAGGDNATAIISARQIAPAFRWLEQVPSWSMAAPASLLGLAAALAWFSSRIGRQRHQPSM